LLQERRDRTPFSVDPQALAKKTFDLGRDGLGDEVAPRRPVDGKVIDDCSDLRRPDVPLARCKKQAPVLRQRVGILRRDRPHTFEPPERSPAQRVFAVVDPHVVPQ